MSCDFGAAEDVLYGSFGRTLHVMSRVLTHPSVHPCVKADDRAVAGFFEDLPVLMFILGGVSMLVFSGVWVSRTMAEQRVEEDLDRLAEDFVAHIMDELGCHGSADVLPTEESIKGLNLSAVALEVIGEKQFSAAILSLHPDSRWILAGGGDSLTTAIKTGYASRLFNAVSAGGLVCVLEVRVIVW